MKERDREKDGEIAQRVCSTGCGENVAENQLTTILCRNLLKIQCLHNSKKDFLCIIPGEMLRANLVWKSQASLSR